MSLQISVDVGGTFTDLVVKDGGGVVRSFKSPTTPKDVTEGIFGGLQQIADHYSVTVQGLLAQCRSFACGTTTATNAILENKGAKTALICTEGFRDTLLIRERGKQDTYNIQVDFPPPYVPRYLTFGVRERINAEGGIETPLDEAELRKIIAQLKEWKVEAVAVALIWSVANPVHEKRIGAILKAEWPEVAVSLSHEVSPTLREYRRTSATVIDASLKPVIAGSVGALDARLAGTGFGGVLTFVTSSGGQTSGADITRRPVHLCFSGPSAAPEAGRRVAALEDLADGNVITVDMGGTSFDVSIMTGWDIPMHREGIIAGHMFGVPSVDVKTIGAGGGSIARADAGGFVHVGPESAGAFPGPACYGRGGTRPTVTDANLVRGLLDPDYFAAGSMKLSVEKAEAALQTVAAPLGIGVQEAASLICVTCEQNMVAAIEDITVRRGIDPRDYAMVAGGAAGGLHAVAIARELGIRTVLVPPVAGVLSAFGIMSGDIKFNFARSLFASSERFDFRAAATVLGELEAEAQDYLERMRVPPTDRALVFSAEARYAGQVWQITLPLGRSRIDDREALDAVVEAFHQLHQKLYFVRSDRDFVEFTEWNVQAIGKLPQIRLEEQPAGGRDPSAARIAERQVFFREAGKTLSMAVFMGERLRAGNEIAGPALIEDALTAVLVPPGARLRVTRYGGYLIETR